MNLASLKPTLHRALDHLVRTVPQASPLRPPDPSATPRAFRCDLAQAEGWDVFACGLSEDDTPRIEIQRLDSVALGQPWFRTDGAAWELIRLWCPTAARLP